MHGIDIEAAFFGLGYELFHDKDTLESTFLAADLTKPSAPTIEVLNSSIDIISAQSLFHLFTLSDQKVMAKHLLALSKPVPGSIIVGRQVGIQHA